MKKYILLFLMCLPFALQAQVDTKYLEGAIPVIDGKVTFTTDIQAKGLSQSQIYETVLNWANKRFQPKDNLNARVLYSNPEENTFIVGGEEYIVFTSNVLALDRTRIYYHLIVKCANENCNLTITRIHYWYDENRDGGYKYKAEEWITDKYGLNKSKTKLALKSGKFRKSAIDYKDELFAEVQKILNSQVVASISNNVQPSSQNVATTANQPVAKEKNTSTPETKVVSDLVPLQPAKEVINTENQEALIKEATRMTITAGNDEQFEINKEAWGGFGKLFNKKAAFCLIDTQKTMGNMLMSQVQEYTISFFLANNNQPCVVIKCKKLMQQTMSGKEAKNMNPNCMESKSYNMYVGEIIE